MMTRLKIILVTFLCPPLMVVGYGMRNILLVLLLTLLGWLPGVVASFIIQAGDIPEDTI
ncbi:MAG: YqaE/Pmp3 family membrane protein [Bacteroidaceae bacterium]|nr:YqaE/Pmp3 family membrane protein [Bacteroidaceae bacterium]